VGLRHSRAATNRRAVAKSRKQRDALRTGNEQHFHVKQMNRAQARCHGRTPAGPEMRTDRYAPRPLQSRELHASCHSDVAYTARLRASTSRSSQAPSGLKYLRAGLVLSRCELIFAKGCCVRFFRDRVEADDERI
jgi:hypothetical protein